MGYRLSKITTRTGDDGTTGLGDGSRVSKASERIVALGEIDELNSHLGVLLCEPLPEDAQSMLTAIQHDLFDVGGQLCVPAQVALSERYLARLDDWIAQSNANLPPLVEFILPGGSRAAALAHVSRAVCRRAERAIVALNNATHAAQYLNRLSDLLFILARVLNRANGKSDVLWRRDHGD